MNDSRNHSGNESGSTTGTFSEPFQNDSPASRAPADLGIKGSRDQGIKGAKTTNSTTDRLTGLRNARDETPDPLNEHCWIAGYRINLINQTVLLASLIRPVTDTLKRKTWATMLRDEGWAFPLRYLAHVEKLLAGADIPVELFNVDGQPTPGQRDRERATERAESRGVLAEIRAARKASQTNTSEIARARSEARQAFADALTSHPPRATTRTES